MKYFHFEFFEYLFSCLINDLSFTRNTEILIYRILAEIDLNRADLHRDTLSDQLAMMTLLWIIKSYLANCKVTHCPNTFRESETPINGSSFQRYPSISQNGNINFVISTTASSPFPFSVKIRL